MIDPKAPRDFEEKSEFFKMIQLVMLGIAPCFISLPLLVSTNRSHQLIGFLIAGLSAAITFAIMTIRYTPFVSVIRNRRGANLDSPTAEVKYYIRLSGNSKSDRYNISADKLRYILSDRIRELGGYNDTDVNLKGHLKTRLKDLGAKSDLLFVLGNYSEREGSLIIEFTVLIMGTIITYGHLRHGIELLLEDLDPYLENLADNLRLSNIDVSIDRDVDFNPSKAIIKPHGSHGGGKKNWFGGLIFVCVLAMALIYYFDEKGEKEHVASPQNIININFYDRSGKDSVRVTTITTVTTNTKKE